MNTIDIVTRFMEKAREDPCIGPSHMSVFIALVLEGIRQQRTQDVSVVRKNIMRDAKIFSIVTYFKCMHDLARCKYLSYSPSNSSLATTRISLLDSSTVLKN